MTLEEFVSKYIGRKVDFDGAYGAQCVDLFRQYNKEVWGNPHTGAVDGAKDLILRYEELPEEQKYLEKISHFFYPSPGDVAVWGATASNKYGHVAIVIHAEGHFLFVFEQNGFVQDGAKLNIRTDDNLLGFLRKKNKK